MSDVPHDDVELAAIRLSNLLGSHRRWHRISHVSKVRHPDVRRAVIHARIRLVDLRNLGQTNNTSSLQLAAVLRSHQWLMGQSTNEPQALDVPTVPTLEQAWSLAEDLHELYLRTAPEKELVRTDSASEKERRGALNQDLDRQTNAALRSRYLGKVGVGLWLLVLAAVTVALGSNDSGRGIVLAAIAGAIGGGFSGAVVLSKTIDAARARMFQSWWWVQPAVGAAVGLLIYAVVLSPIVELPGTSDSAGDVLIAVTAVYAFAAGFSEPFVLKLLQRITGAEESARVEVATDEHADVDQEASEPPMSNGERPYDGTKKPEAPPASPAPGTVAGANQRSDTARSAREDADTGNGHTGDPADDPQQLARRRRPRRRTRSPRDGLSDDNTDRNADG